MANLRLKEYHDSSRGNLINTYNLDLVSIKNSDYKLGEFTITNDAKDNKATEHYWDVNLIFRNYRDYIQNNNANKNIHGELIFKSKGCVKVK